MEIKYTFGKLGFGEYSINFDGEQIGTVTNTNADVVVVIIESMNKAYNAGYISGRLDGLQESKSILENINNDVATKFSY